MANANHQGDDGLGNERLFRSGELIFAVGDLASSVYLIKEGSVRLSVKRSDGSDLTFESIQEGLFGEVAVLSGTTRTATAHADGPARLVEIKAEAFTKRFDADPEFRSTVVSQMANRLRRSASQLQRAATLNADDIVLQESTPSQKAIDHVAKAIGTTGFVAVVAVLITLWIGINQLQGDKRFDSGFTYLALLLSFVSLAVTAIVLNSQNRAATLVSKRSKVEFEANVLAQRQIEALHERFTQLQERLNS